MFSHNLYIPLLPLLHYLPSCFICCLYFGRSEQPVILLMIEQGDICFHSSVPKILWKFRVGAIITTRGGHERLSGRRHTQAEFWRRVGGKDGLYRKRWWWVLRYTKARLLVHSVLGAFVSDINLEWKGGGWWDKAREGRQRQRKTLCSNFKL